MNMLRVIAKFESQKLFVSLEKVSSRGNKLGFETP